MAKKENLTPIVKFKKLFTNGKNWWQVNFRGRKRFLFTGVAIVFLLLGAKILTSQNGNSNINTRIAFVVVNKSFEFPGLTNQGKVKDKVKLNVASAEKNTEVVVKDQTFRAKNNKLFLIVNLELTNDTAAPLNIVPGDLIRLTIAGDDTKKFAPDLHNNMVLIAPISTRLDRVGFVIDKTALNLKLLVGQLEDKKEAVPLPFGR